MENMPRVQNQSMDRFRVSVPSNDKTVIEWIANQANLSYSFRVLVKEYVREHGLTDATCMEIVPGGRRRGRPRKDLTDVVSAAQEAYEDDVVDEEEIETDDVEVKSETVAPAKKTQKTEPEPKVETKENTTTPATKVSTDEDGFVDDIDGFFS